MNPLIVPQLPSPLTCYNPFRMKLPRWATPAHPIYRREAERWRNTGKRWRWLWIPFLLFPVCCSAVCGLTMLPLALEDNSVPAWLLTLAVMLLIGVWSLHSFLAWGVGLFVNVGAATLIARERETQNWPLLRLTIIGAHEILAAKIAALLRWLRWPIAVVLIMRIAAVVITFAAAFALIYFAPLLDPTFTPQVQFALWIISGAVAGVALTYALAEFAASLLYNCGIGLLASSFTRANATAVAAAFVLNFVVNLVIFAPIQQLSIPFLTLLSAALSSPPPVVVTASITTLFILPLIVESVIAIGALIIAFDQAKRIVE